MAASKRILAAGLVIALTWTLLTARAFDLQVLSGRRYREQIRETRRILTVIHPPRGRLLDRNGVVLADNERTFELYVIPRRLERHPESIDRLAALLRIPREEILSDLKDVHERIEKLVSREKTRWARDLRRRGEKRYPWAMKRQVPFEAAYAIEMRSGEYAGFSVRAALRRIYPAGTTGGQVVGYVGRVGEKEYERFLEEGIFVPNLRDILGEDGADRLRRRGEFMRALVGRSGAEALFDRELRGAGGLVIRQKNLVTGARSVLVLAEAVPGKDVTLTLDIGLQRRIEAILDADPHDHVVALVADVRSGDVLAMATKPRYDPNVLAPPVQKKRALEYFRDDAHRPLVDRSTHGLYPLGSIFKIVTGWAGLVEGRVRPAETIDCRGFMFEGEKAFRCWIYRGSGVGHGPLALPEALESSCNCYFYELGRRLRLAGIEKTARAFGFGRTSLGLPGELRGQLPSDARPRRWTSRDTMALAIGQSILLVTPVQVLQMMVLVANDGRGPALRLARGQPERRIEAPLPPSGVRAIRRGLEAVVAGERGTARDAGLARFGVAGKTGSAQVGGGRPAHAWFAGFAPAEDPEVAVVVLVEHGGSGGEVAAPIARRIFEAMKSR